MAEVTKANARLIAKAGPTGPRTNLKQAGENVKNAFKK
jgi:hypothetical protein